MIAIRHLPLRTWMKAAGALIGALAAFMLLVHVPFGRRLLAPFYAAKCPVGAVTPAQVEQARSDVAREYAGDKPAAVRPALGFDLEKTHVRDVQAWAQTHGVTCKSEREGALLRCTQVPTAAIQPVVDGPPLSEVLFAFEPQGMKLVNMTVYYERATEEVAAARAAAVGAHMQRAVGAPGKKVGDFDAAYLKDGKGMRVALVEYRFADYHATISTTRFEPGRVMLREHYMAGPTVPAQSAAGATAAK